MSFTSAVYDTHLTNVFNMFLFFVFLYSSLFTNKIPVTGQQLALWLLTDLLSRFLEDLTSLPSDGFFYFKIILQSFIK